MIEQPPEVPLDPHDDNPDELAGEPVEPDHDLDPDTLEEQA